MKAVLCIVAIALAVSGCGASRIAAPVSQPTRQDVVVISPVSAAGVYPAWARQVPSSIPPCGVQLRQPHMLLRPWRSTPAGAMSRTQAIVAALYYADKAPTYPRRALRAELTRPGTVASCAHLLARVRAGRDNAPRVWVVTFTFPKPVNVGQGGPGAPPVYVTHYSVVVDAVTGKFALGFFER